MASRKWPQIRYTAHIRRDVRELKRACARGGASTQKKAGPAFAGPAGGKGVRGEEKNGGYLPTRGRLNRRCQVLLRFLLMFAEASSCIDESVWRSDFERYPSDSRFAFVRAMRFC